VFSQYFDGAEQIKKIAEAYRKPMNEVAFNWLRQEMDVTFIIGGASTVEQLEQNIQCTTWEVLF
jgi:aryl-alcohol dehydrogenase-like predicted oxidoreductase